MRSVQGAMGTALRGVPKSLSVRLIRYGIVGALSTAIYFGLAVLLIEVLEWDPVVGAILACSATIVFAYAANHRWVFASSRAHTGAFLSFVLATIISLSLNVSVMFVVVHVLGWWYLIGLLLTTIIVPPTNFALNYLWCFRNA